MNYNNYTKKQLIELLEIDDEGIRKQKATKKEIKKLQEEQNMIYGYKKLEKKVNK